MTLGIVAWVVALLSFFLLGSLALLLSLIGLPFAVAGVIREPQGRAMAIAGVVLTLAGLFVFP